MNQHCIFGISAIAALGLALVPLNALAQQKPLKEQLAGAWTAISMENIEADGTKRQTFGANPKGIMIFSTNGQYVQVLLRSDVPMFNINDRLEGTTEENRAAVHGTSAQFGTWSVDEMSRILTVRIEGNMFPNSMGTESNLTAVVLADQLRLVNPEPASGSKIESIWKRGTILAAN